MQAITARNVLFVSKSYLNSIQQLVDSRFLFVPQKAKCYF